MKQCAIFRHYQKPGLCVRLIDGDTDHWRKHKLNFGITAFKALYIRNYTHGDCFIQDKFNTLQKKHHVLQIFRSFSYPNMCNFKYKNSDHNLNSNGILVTSNKDVLKYEFQPKPSPHK